ncbi:MAG: acyltransferase [Catenulisporales bacterium]|nr:acyltransferase [Catenulisporales bacterium]
MVSALGSRLAAALWGWLGRAGKVRAGSAAARRFAEFGEGSTIAFPPGTIFGERYIAIGAHVLVGANVTISAGFVPGLDLGPAPLVRIGDGVVLGRGGHVVGHRSIDIGADVYTGPNVYITDQNHRYDDPDVPIGKQWPSEDPVRIGPGCWIGANAVILPGTVLGRNVVVAAGSVVRGEFPDHCVVGGVPARMLRRYEPSTGWARVDSLQAQATNASPASG